MNCFKSTREKSSRNFSAWPFLALAILACLVSPARANQVTVTLPDRTATLPVVTVGRGTYLDVRTVAALVSAKCQVDAARGRASVRLDQKTVVLRVGASTVRLGDRAVSLPSPPRLVGRRFLAPIELLPVVLAEQYGRDGVEWIPERRLARVRSRDVTIRQLRVGVYPTHTRVVLETVRPLEWSIQREGSGADLRVMVPGGVLGKEVQPLTLRAGTVRTVQPSQLPGGAEVRIIGEGKNAGIRTFTLTRPDRIVIDILAGRAAEPERTAPQESPPTPPGLGGPLTVVLDPGHGGHDTGAVGPTGLMEKDVVLDLALRLRRLLARRLGMRVIMTRSEDVFVPLQERTAIANRARADFFLSLHMNGATKRGAGGFETFYFTREPSDNDARTSAQRENLIIEPNGAAGKDLESLLKTTLADLAVTRDMRESSELAELVLASLGKLLKMQSRGVKSGPFYVLATAAMPAVLVESAFITNPREERRLRQEAYRQRLVEALYEGVAKYKIRYERRIGMENRAAAAANS